MAQRSITVGIVDDEPFVRHALRSYLMPETDIKLVAEAADSQGALDLVDKYSPDLLLLDLQLPDIDGIEVTRRLVDQQAQTRVVVVTAHISDRYVIPALVAGASGYIVKDSEPVHIVHAIREVAEGGLMIDQQITRHLIKAVARVGTPCSLHGIDLTERERQVLNQLCSGQSNSEIASTLFLSESTIKYYLSNLMQKFGSRDRVQLVISAFRSGVVS